MEPVIGLDVAKGSSVFQAFLRRNESYGKTENVTHDERGFKRLGELVTELRELTGIEPVIILEATGHYHRRLVTFFTREEIKHFIINPLQSKRAKGTQLRKVKTDATDAWNLAEMYYRGDVKPHRTWEESYKELQYATRQHEFVTVLYVQAKLNARALLDQVFPEYESVFYDLYCFTALMVLQGCLRGNIGEIEKGIFEFAGKSHSKGWVREKLERLDNALSLWAKESRSSSQVIALEGMITLLLALQAQLGQLEEQMKELAINLPEVTLVKSIPGIGDKLAATIISEIGDAKQFRNAKQLVAYAGLDPGVHSSGKFTASRNRITKRGSKRLRRALYLAVKCGLRCGSVNHRLKNYYDKKKKEGKPYKVAVIACANKLLHHIYAILNQGQPYKM
jgi:transposase